MRQTSLLFFLFCLPIFAWTQSEDQSTSPYFVVSSSEKGELLLPLKHTEAEVNIAGTIADVRITQVYQNTGTIPLEAQYVFPASTRAAVYGMDMTVGNRQIEAKIKEKVAARQTYEQAKAKGQTASLLEQHRPNVFQMQVANILPGDSVVIHLSYTELLTSKEGIYEFVYPTVVGPRYIRPEDAVATSAETWPANPTTEEGVLPSYTFGFQGRVAGGVPVQNLHSPSHSLAVQELENGQANFKLSPNDTLGGNRDLVFRYSLKGDKIQSGMLTYQEKGEKFFLWTVQPPERVEPASITAREYIFIVDVSGSMRGFPLNITKSLLKNLIGDLKETDRFNVILFAGSSNIMDNKVSIPATKQNIQRAIDFINSQGGGGGTSLLPAIERGLQLESSPGFARSFVLCTDGYVSVEDEAYDLVREHMGEANFFTFGMGTSVNRAIIEGLAEVGQGEAFVAMNAEESKEVGAAFQTYIQSPVLTDIHASFGDMEVYDIEPLGLADVFSDRPIVIHGKYKGKLEGTAVLQAVSGNQPYQETINLSHIKPESENRALRYLWARQRIHRLSDVRGAKGAASTQEEVTALGLQYNLLTRFTSFVAVDKKRRNKNGQDTTIRQTLPLPKGVSNQAVQAPRTAYSKSVKSGYLPTPASGTAFDGSMKLEEVVVTGYGVSRESRAISYVVTMIDNKSVSVLNSGSMLQGQVAGVQVVHASGSPGANASIFVRGATSAMGSCQPLFVVDGIVQEPGFLPQGAGGSGMPTHLSQHLSPDEIDEITVLKSSSATALYGARAANGVILIKTKRPSSSDASWTWNGQLGIQMIQARNRNLAQNIPYPLRAGLQTQQFLKYQKNQQKQSFLASLSHRLDQGLIQGSNYEQLSSRLRYQRTLKHQWQTEAELTANQAIQSPLLLDWLGLDSLQRTDVSRQPEFFEAFSSRIRSRYLQGRAKIKGDLLPWMSWTSHVSWQGRNIFGQQFAPISLWGQSKEEGYKMESRTAFRQFQQTHHLSLVPRSFGKWETEGKLSWQHLAQQWNHTGMVAYGIDATQALDEAKIQHPLQLDMAQQLHLLSQQASIRWSNIIKTDLGLSWGRMRRGTNGLGWKAFPSGKLRLKAANNWRIKDWMDPSVSLSYSEMGNDRLPMFAFGGAPIAFDSQNPYSLALFSRRLPINQLNWEVSQEWDAGLDLHLWNHKISISQHIYRKVTRDFWAEVPISTNGDLFWEVRNVGDVLQRGSETSINTYWYGRDWQVSWGSNFNFQQNRVLKLSEPEGIETGILHPLSGSFVPIGTIQQGHSLMSFQGYELDDQGKPLSDPEVLGSALPNFLFGSHAVVSYKRIKLRIKGYGATGQKVLNLSQLNGQSIVTEDMVESASFVRLSNIQLESSWPLKRAPKIKALTLRAGISNVFVWTPYSGFDPEVNVLGQQRSILMGVDAAAYPRPRTVWMGVEMKIK
ncbi:MAG: VIT domain-containing protein [Bacteroidota bacterium]